MDSWLGTINPHWWNTYTIRYEGAFTCALKAFSKLISTLDLFPKRTIKGKRKRERKAKLIAFRQRERRRDNTRKAFAFYQTTGVLFPFEAEIAKLFDIDGDVLDVLHDFYYANGVPFDCAPDPYSAFYNSFGAGVSWGECTPTVNLFPSITYIPTTWTGTF